MISASAIMTAPTPRLAQPDPGDETIESFLDAPLLLSRRAATASASLVKKYLEYASAMD
jgi:hypothetical protein